MSERSSRFALPFIVPGQAQKEHFHNEALVLADALLHPAAESGPASDPPADPEPGQIWIVAVGAAGDWSGKAHMLAISTGSGWRFAPPVPGMLVWNKATALWIHWTGTAWSSGEMPASRLVIGGQQVVGQRAPAVPSPSGGTVIDAEARNAVNQLIVALRSHGLIE